MNTIDDITFSFDGVMEKASKSWERIVTRHEARDGGFIKDIQYHSEVRNFDVVLGHSYHRGIFGGNHLHTLEIYRRPRSYCDYPLITFTGSCHFWSSEGRRIEYRLKCLERYLDQYYGEWDKKQELEESRKKEEKQRETRNQLIKTFPLGGRKSY